MEIKIKYYCDRKITVISGKQGVGKTTLSKEISRFINAYAFTVDLIDLDFIVQQLSGFIGLDEQIIRFDGVMKSEIKAVVKYLTNLETKHKFILIVQNS